MPTPLEPAYWNDRYAEAGFAYGEEPNAFLASVVDRIPARGRVLVPGDGEGRNGVWLAQQGFEVTSVDLSEVGCAKARRLAAERGVALTAICADLRNWQWPKGAFDAVVAIFLHVTGDVRPVLHRAMREALAPGGVIVIEAFELGHLPHRQRQPSVGGPADAALLYTLDMLKSDFAPLRATFADTLEVDLAEGQYHRGRGAVVRAVFG